MTSIERTAYPLREMETNVPAFAQELRTLLASGQRFPNWKNEDLVEVLPDERARQQVLAEVRPRALDFFDEVMPDISNDLNAKSGYLLFTQGYHPYLEQAQRAGWPCRTIPAQHFHMLVDPITVAMTLVELTKQINEKL